MEPLTDRIIRDAMSALGVYRNQPKVYKFEYVRQDDLFQNRLDELERIEALEYAAEDASWEYPEPAESDWEYVHYKIAREKTFRAPIARHEMSEMDIRERINFLQKRMRRNGAVQCKLEFEKELRELQKQLKSVEASGITEDAKHWD